MKFINSITQWNMESTSKEEKWEDMNEFLMVFLCLNLLMDLWVFNGRLSFLFLL